MNTNQNLPSDASIAYLLLRLSLGLVIFLHGMVRLAGHYQQFVDSTLQSSAKTPLSISAVHFAAASFSRSTSQLPMTQRN